MSWYDKLLEPWEGHWSSWFHNVKDMRNLAIHHPWSASDMGGSLRELSCGICVQPLAVCMRTELDCKRLRWSLWGVGELSSIETWCVKCEQSYADRGLLSAKYKELKTKYPNNQYISEQMNYAILRRKVIQTINKYMSKCSPSSVIEEWESKFH